MSKIYYEIEENKKLISFGFFDMGRNSHQAMRVPNENLFIRLYKLGNFGSPVDWVFKDLQNFEAEVHQFIESSQTFSVQLSKLDEDV